MFSSRRPYAILGSIQWEIQLGGCHLDDIECLQSLNYSGCLLAKSYTLKWSVDFFFVLQINLGLYPGMCSSTLSSKYTCVLQTWTLLVSPICTVIVYIMVRISERKAKPKKWMLKPECLGNTYELPVLMFILLPLLSLWGLPRPQVGDAQGMVMRRCHDFCLSSQAIRVILDLSLFCDSCPLGHKWFGTTKYGHQHLFTCFGLCLRSRTLTLVHKTLLYQVTEYRDSATKPN